jgi:RimJ/RimL family protein N-acetyltransferase
VTLAPQAVVLDGISLPPLPRSLHSRPGGDAVLLDEAEQPRFRLWRIRAGALALEALAAIGAQERAATLDAAFGLHADISEIDMLDQTGTKTVRRRDFYQQRALWHHSLGLLSPDARLRPGLPAGVQTLYRRRCHAIGRTFSLRPLRLPADLDRFVSWMNDPVVARFWELDHDEARLRAYLEDKLADPHLEPLIGSFDDQPFAYFEVYWAREDRVGPHYDAGPFDRGYHMAVGEPAFRGKGLGRHWFLSMSHFAFLDDPRTVQLVGEPRLDQQQVRSWADSTPWRFEKEITFPHKRAALMLLGRDTFFDEVRL